MTLTPKTAKVHNFAGETCAECIATACLARQLLRCKERALPQDQRSRVASECSPNTLRAWERRFGYPKPQRSPGKHRLYTYGEIAALKDALQEGLSISSAVSRAREGLSADADTLVGALSSFDRERADGAMEAALALRSLERSVEEVLLPSLEELQRRHGLDSAAWAFGARWADDWLRRAQRLAPPPVRQIALLVGDATGDELDPDASAVRALELFCARAGVRMLCLSVPRSQRSWRCTGDARARRCRPRRQPCPRRSGRPLGVRGSHRRRRAPRHPLPSRSPPAAPFADDRSASSTVLSLRGAKPDSRVDRDRPCFPGHGYRHGPGAYSSRSEKEARRLMTTPRRD